MFSWCEWGISFGKSTDTLEIEEEKVKKNVRSPSTLTPFLE